MCSNGGSISSDTSLTKVFVGGLAWETPKDSLRDHFNQYGDIIEAVIIVDKVSGRSKGYGFVTFRDADAARRACEDSTPVINGRRANCNLASLGARRQRSRPPTPPAPAAGPRSTAAGQAAPAMPRAANQVSWFYTAAAGAAPPSPYHHSVPPPSLPFYAYHPAYMAPSDLSYNHKSGAYGVARFSQGFPAGGGQGMVGMSGGMMPLYPYYFLQNQSQAMGLAFPMLPPTSTVSPSSNLSSKPAAISTVPGAAAACLTVE